ncbi:CoxG family protein [Halapricum desulfuricans]|uniref:Carbon monoxide dehydrogenase subunit G, CoxG n=1 Tax=Halapricum desulfuricans TaxID=2841257 RepID=A0A897N5K6_9EURY|nr:SRPBCC domain-containing protein [Halapricum desulfuricans]QSG07548.1 Carbon monoxide dehydrogenase subunit G, CoxG [Halapricum desulfuricans]
MTDNIDQPETEVSSAQTGEVNERPETSDTGDESATAETSASEVASESDFDEEEARLEFSDTVTIETGKDDLWAFISRAENLAECIPGAESVERLSERQYTCEITRGISRVRVSLDGEFELVEMNEPDWIVMEGNGFDSTTGSDFDVLAAMEMDEHDEGTNLSYSAELYYTGGVARLGARLLSRVIEGDIETYFQNIKDEVEAQ